MMSQIFIEKKLILDIKEDKTFPFCHLLPEEKARSLSLLERVLRNLTSLDNEINQYLEKKTSANIINILRIAAAEMFFDKIPSHAVVDSAVRLAKLDKKLCRFSGLVNAVCRKLVKKLISGVSLNDPFLSAEFVRGLKKNYDIETIRRFSLAQRERPPLDITVKFTRLEKYYANLLKGNLLPSGTVRLRSQNQVTKIPGFQDGDWWVQDFSASLPIKLLGSIKGLKALDVCAAPGGKTLQLASGGADVTSVEISPKRAARLLENLKRTKLSAKVVICDFHEFKSKNLFDIVLVDAPCSSTGTLRRNCDLQYLNPYKRVDTLTKHQISIMKKAMLLVKPGGQLLYCTCSLNSSEGEEVIEEILQYSPHWKQEVINCKSLGISSAWIDDVGGLRLRPDFWQHIGGMDGFYIAMLSRKIDKMSGV